MSINSVFLYVTVKKQKDTAMKYIIISTSDNKPHRLRGRGASQDLLPPGEELLWLPHPLQLLHKANRGQLFIWGDGQ